MQRVLRILARLDLKHKECRRARISQGYRAGKLQPHYLIQLKYKTVAVTEAVMNTNTYFKDNSSMPRHS